MLTKRIVCLLLWFEMKDWRGLYMRLEKKAHVVSRTLEMFWWEGWRRDLGV